MKLAILLVALLFSGIAWSELQCDVDLKFGLLVNKKHIRVTDDGRTVYQINHKSQLIVGGEVIELSKAQRNKLVELSKGLHYVVPKMTLLATEGVQLAVETVEHVYLGLVGPEHKSYDKLQTALQRVHKRVKENYIHSGDYYFIGAGSLENVDELVDEELEEQIEAAINTSLGGILSVIGGLVIGDGTTEERMADLSQRLEIMGEQIEREVGDKAENLRQKATWFCNKMKKLDRAEEALREQIKALKPYNIIVTGHVQSAAR